MDVFLIIIGSILMFAGFVGCFLPILPGPSLSYVGLLMLQLQTKSPFSIKFMIIWAVIVVAVVLIDYLVPAYGTKKYGGSKYGVWGTFVGLFVGLIIFPPIGFIIGALLGALIGEYIAGKDSKQALRAALGSFIGFLMGTFIKLVTCGVMTYYFITALI